MPQFVATRCHRCGHISERVKCVECGEFLIYERGEIKCSGCGRVPDRVLQHCSACDGNDVRVDFMPM